MAARARDQHAVLLEQAHRRAVQLAIGARPGRDVRAGLDQRRRVEHDQPEPLAGRARARAARRTTSPRRNPTRSRDAVARRVARRGVERRLRGVDRQHLARAAARRVQRPLALVAEQVEHAPARRRGDSAAGGSRAGRGTGRSSGRACRSTSTRKPSSATSTRSGTSPHHDVALAAAAPRARAAASRRCAPRPAARTRARAPRGPCSDRRSMPSVRICTASQSP